MQVEKFCWTIKLILACGKIFYHVSIVNKFILSPKERDAWPVIKKGRIMSLHVTSNGMILWKWMRKKEKTRDKAKGGAYNIK